MRNPRPGIKKAVLACGATALALAATVPAALAATSATGSSHYAGFDSPPST